MTEHLSDLALDAIRLGTDGAPGRAHVDGCPHCGARLRALEAEAAAFHARFDAVGLAADALGRAEAARARPRGGPLRWLLGAPTVLASIIAAVAVWEFSPGTHVRSKGDAPLAELFVIDGAERALVDGPVAAQAHLAVRIAPHQPKDVRLLWSSAPDAWSALYPSSDARAWNVPVATWLEREIVLDGAPEPEWLGVVACDEPIDHATAAGLLRGDHRDDCVVESVRIEKR